jgi:hypothetical protein
MAEPATTTLGIRPFNALYGGAFQNAMNDLFSSVNVRETAKRIIELEKTYGPFEVGKFNRYLVPDFALPAEFTSNGGWAKFEADFFSFPEAMRKSVSEVLRQNFLSDTPLPVHYRTSVNVSPTHDMAVKPFTANGTLYLGVLYLCPNPNLPQ